MSTPALHSLDHTHTHTSLGTHEHKWDSKKQINSNIEYTLTHIEQQMFGIFTWTWDRFPKHLCMSLDTRATCTYVYVWGSSREVSHFDNCPTVTQWEHRHVLTLHVVLERKDWTLSISFLEVLACTHRGTYQHLPCLGSARATCHVLVERARARALPRHGRCCDDNRSRFQWFPVPYLRRTCSAGEEILWEEEK